MERDPSSLLLASDTRFVYEISRVTIVKNSLVKLSKTLCTWGFCVELLLVPFFIGILEPSDGELAQHQSSLCPLYHPQRGEAARCDRCPAGVAPATLQRCAGGHPYLPQGIPQQASLPRIQAKVGIYPVAQAVVKIPLFRYAILAPKAIPAGFMDGRKAVELLLEALQLETSEYRLGYSKVFFRAGVLGRLEDLRDERLAKIITQFQAFLRGFMMRRLYRKLQDQRLAIAVIQRNVRKHLFLRDWKWWKLYTKVRKNWFSMPSLVSQFLNICRSSPC